MNHMSNRTGSRQHGLHRVKRMQPTKKWGKKQNKENNRAAQAKRNDVLQAALKEGLAMAA